jgi:pyrroline-5-carboxylate reductase
MGGALAKAAAKGGARIALYDLDGQKAAALAEELHCATADMPALVQNCRYVMLGVKPHQLRGVCSELSALENGAQPVYVSMAAGVTTAQLDDILPGAQVIRIMPNTPCAVGAGLITYCLGARCTQEAAQAFLALMAQAGEFDLLDEHLIDAASAVAGCGPAFAALFMEALADGGVLCGLPRAKALKYAQQMLLGTAQLALESGLHPGVMKDQVCSPGGSTIAGVQALEDGAFRASVIRAVRAAHERNLTLGKS